jgi:hypothetical protein
MGRQKMCLGPESVMPMSRLVETVNNLTEALYPLSRSSEAGVDSMTGASLYQPDLI